MNVFTHLAIAIRTKRAVESMLPVKLSTYGFLYGSVKPDISRSFKGIPHYIDGSIDFVYNKIDELLNSDYCDFAEHKDDFSERLGVITHFLADYFCYAHSKKFSGGIIRHYIYEMKLMLFFKIRLKEFLNPDNYLNTADKQDSSEVCDFIDGLLDEYYGAYEKPSPYFDMAFTYEVCIALCMTVLTSCATEERRTEMKLAEAFV